MWWRRSLCSRGQVADVSALHPAKTNRPSFRVHSARSYVFRPLHPARPSTAMATAPRTTKSSATTPTGNLLTSRHCTHPELDVMDALWMSYRSQYRPKVGKFVPEDIQPDLCTHIIFAFGWIKKGKISSLEANDETKDGNPGLYERIMDLKKVNPSLKILLAIGNSLFHIQISYHSNG